MAVQQGVQLFGRETVDPAGVAARLMHTAEMLCPITCQNPVAVAARSSSCPICCFRC